MPITWIENCTSQRIQKWAYNLYLNGDAVYANNRQKYGFPVTAEIKLTAEDIERFSPELDKAVAILMYHQDFINLPTDLEVKYLREEIIFAVECVD